MDYKELVQELRRLSLDYGEQDSLNTILYLAANAIEDLITNLTASNEVIAKYRGQMPKWIPLKWELPGIASDYPWEMDGEWAIFTDGKNISVERAKKDAQDHFFPRGTWFAFADVTHWMPLPPPPIIPAERGE